MTEWASAYAEGLEASTGVRVESVDDPVGWCAEAGVEGPAGLLITVRGEDDLDLLAQASRLDQVVVVALVTAIDHDSWTAVFRAGADGVAAWSAPTELLAEVLEAAARGEVHLPVEIVRGWADRSRRLPDLAAMSSGERRWLQALSDGSSVVALARAEDLPLRTLNRRLENLYLRMGAINRDQAVKLAARVGLVE